MRRFMFSAVAITVALLASCAALQSPQAVAPASGRRIAAGTVTQISSGHGNVYTSIAPDQYKPLGLERGMRICVAFADTAVTLAVGRDYAEVPSGTPLAVLHREGLTFAVRDGNFSATYGVVVGAQFSISTVPQE